MRLYNEERERPVYLLVDQRLDMYFATRGLTKSVAAAHLAALLAWRSWHDGDRLGAAVFSDDTLRLQRCRSPKLALAPCLNDLHQMNNQLPARYPQEPASSLPLHQVLQRIRAQVPAGSWLALISDFHDLDAQSDALLARWRAGVISPPLCCSTICICGFRIRAISPRITSISTLRCRFRPRCVSRLASGSPPGWHSSRRDCCGSASACSTLW